MKKFFAILCVTILVVGLVESCKPPGLLCNEDKDCCAPLVCNPWAGRCTKPQAPPAATNKPSNPPAPIVDGQM
ncbi:uncharacterized protein LOC117218317 [Megalopta genalis]|uniref:uncharacterized protein LOC117218317 n=1 Tax=Megalopta genalis TaxID=115081 RepID=UPI003FD3DA45